MAVDGALQRVLGERHRLVVFDAVVAAGSFTRAAEELGISQPAVSRQIAGLEDRLGVELFHRDQGRAAPTDAARTLHTHLASAFAELRDGIGSISVGAATLTVAVQPAIADSWFSPRILDLRAALAPVTLRLVVFDRSDDLDTLDHDVSVRFTDRTGRGHRSTRLVHERVRPYCAPGLAERLGLDATTTPARLAGCEPLLQLDPDGRRWLTWTQWFAAHDLTWVAPTDDIVQRSYGMVLQQALSGRGVVLGWDTLLGELVTNGMLVPVGPPVERRDIGYRLVWAAGAERRPGLAALRRWLVETVGTLERAGVPDAASPAGAPSSDGDGDRASEG